VRQTGKDTQEPRPYLSYLLRLWQAGSAGGKVWRASLESVQSGERLAFANLATLFEYLRARTSIEGTADLGGRASARPRPPRCSSDDANSVDPKAVDL
jgi:hypothetical protein